MIRTLKENKIFVFGSNLAGYHAAGAAFQAKKKFGAVEGIGEGITGRCYALPTLDKNLGKFSDEDFYKHVLKFRKCAEARPGLEFLLTKIGCGIAGYSEEYVKEKFKKVPKNVVKPKDW